jgi:hypothetical protein
MVDHLYKWFTVDKWYTEYEFYKIFWLIEILIFYGGILP